jgi:hypothetical protein
MKQIATRLIATNIKLEKSVEEYFHKSNFVFGSILRTNNTAMETGLNNLINYSKYKYYETLFGLGYMSNKLKTFEQV